MTDHPIVLMLSDGLTLDDVRQLTTPSDGAAKHSVTVYSAGHAQPQGIIGTEAQIIRMRDVLDAAVSRIRENNARHRLVSMEPLAVAERIMDDARRALAEAFDEDPDNPPPFAEILNRLEAGSAS